MRYTEEEMERRRALLCAQYGTVQQFVRCCGVPAEEQEDVVQEVFISAWTHLEQLHDPDRILPWLYRITKNKAARLFGQRKRERLRREELEQYLAVQKLDVSYRRTGGDTAETQLLVELVERLEPPAPRILQLRFGMGFTLKEIAEMLNMNYNTVKTVEHRALARLRAMLEAEEADAR